MASTNGTAAAFPPHRLAVSCTSASFRLRYSGLVNVFRLIRGSPRAVLARHILIWVWMISDTTLPPPEYGDGDIAEHTCFFSVRVDSYASLQLLANVHSVSAWQKTSPCLS
jgi:hypothetical protein